MGKTMPIYTTKLADMENIREGRLIPRSCLGECLLSESSLEDYAMTQEENFHAKEIAELPEVIEYINEHDLKGHIVLQFVHASPPIERVPAPESFFKSTVSTALAGFCAQAVAAGARTSVGKVAASLSAYKGEVHAELREIFVLLLEQRECKS